jgi:hypothetical protein
MAMPFAMGMQTARFVLVIGDRTGNRALRRRAERAACRLRSGMSRIG